MGWIYGNYFWRCAWGFLKVVLDWAWLLWSAIATIFCNFAVQLKDKSLDNQYLT
jgi:hypothetical protein|tara:strand:+ start:4039 stop:4200 length:162 start_codon:yes stop_codon:yes gene_type:complete